MLEITHPEPIDAPVIIAEAEGYKAYLLPPDQWRERLDYPTLPDPAAAFILVVEHAETGEIAASWSCQSMNMLEGLSVKAAHRTPSEVVQGLLLGSMLAMMKSLNIRHPLTLAQDPAILRLARKAGFAEVPGTLLMLE